MPLPAEVLSQIPAEYHASLEKYSDLPSMVKSHSEMEKYQGRSIGLPGQTDDVAKWKIDNLVNLPYQTLDTFCNAVQQGDYQTAYDQLSLGYQQRLSKQQFATALSWVSSCKHDFPIQSGDSATANMQLADSSGQTVNLKVFLIKDNNGDWKIDSLQKA